MINAWNKENKGKKELKGGYDPKFENIEKINEIGKPKNVSIDEKIKAAREKSLNLRNEKVNKVKSRQKEIPQKNQAKPPKTTEPTTNRNLQNNVTLPSSSTCRFTTPPPPLYF